MVIEKLNEIRLQKGVCPDCGEELIGGKCPNCDDGSEEESDSEIEAEESGDLEDESF